MSKLSDIAFKYVDWFIVVKSIPITDQSLNLPIKSFNIFFPSWSPSNLEVILVIPAVESKDNISSKALKVSITSAMLVASSLINSLLLIISLIFLFWPWVNVFSLSFNQPFRLSILSETAFLNANSFLDFSGIALAASSGLDSLNCSYSSKVITSFNPDSSYSSVISISDFSASSNLFISLRSPSNSSYLACSSFRVFIVSSNCVTMPGSVSVIVISLSFFIAPLKDPSKDLAVSKKASIDSTLFKSISFNSAAYFPLTPFLFLPNFCNFSWSFIASCFFTSNSESFTNWSILCSNARTSLSLEGSNSFNSCKIFLTLLKETLPFRVDFSFPFLIPANSDNFLNKFEINFFWETFRFLRAFSSALYNSLANFFCVIVILSEVSVWPVCSLISFLIDFLEVL